MATTHPKNNREQYRVFRLRIIVTVALVLLMLGGLIWRMAYIQIARYEHYISKADDNRIQERSIEPVRGKIFDRNGVVLAKNRVTLSLAITKDPKRKQKLSELLGKIKTLVPITERDQARFDKDIRYAGYYQPVILKRNLTPEEAATLEVRQYHLPGIRIVAEHERVYRHTIPFAHVVGHVGKINRKELAIVNAEDYQLTANIGKSGVEKSYETLLHGKAGRKHVETDVNGKVLRTISVDPPKPGGDVYLTIDMRLQEYAYRLMRGRRGAIVAIDPRNFEVLALVSSPGFDGNLFVNGISHEEYNALRDSPDIPLFNRAIQGNYPPASTFKPFIALAGLEHRVVSFDDEIMCRGFYMLKNSKHKFRDWKRWGHRETNMNKAIVESCDVYFYDLAFNLGIDRIHPFMTLFGFGKKTGVDLPFESAGVMPSRDNISQGPGRSRWIAGDTLNVGIGQGKVQVSPLQLTKAVAILANNGKGAAPHVVHRIDNNGKSTSLSGTLDTLAPVKRIGNWIKIKQAMKNVVHSKRGTARAIAKDISYTVAGKTGTAQVFTVKQNERYNEDEIAEYLKDHALFVAFAPVESPKIALAVIIENAGHGGAEAVPVARKVLDKYLVDILGNVP
jgi:penicillin-binding protein 2